MKMCIQNVYSQGVILLLLLSMSISICFSSDITRASVSSANKQGNDVSNFSSISADGRYVTFSSYASNLMEGAYTKGIRHIYLRDRLTGLIKLISVNSLGHNGNADSWNAVISADGRLVAFTSSADNLVSGDTNGVPDVFVRNLEEGTTVRVSINSEGLQSNLDSDAASISADGTFIAFDSWASNLVSDDTNGERDIFVHDLEKATTIRVSIDSAGQQVAAYSEDPSISADGRYVAFMSKGETLIAGDTNGRPDIFVRDLKKGATTRVSINSAGGEAGNWSRSAAISANGNLVAFTSKAKLVPSDTNGTWDAYVHNRSTGETYLASANSLAVGADSYTTEVTISADGSIVAFSSPSTNLVADDTNNVSDVFIHNLASKKTDRMSIGVTHLEGDGVSEAPALSADGRHITFTSYATNLVQADTNNVQDIFVRDRLLKKTKNADIVIAVNNKPDSVEKDQVATYVFDIMNNSENSAENVSLINVISKGKVLSLSPSQGYCKKAAVTVCRFGTLAAYSSVTLTALVQASDKNLSQQLSVSASLTDPEPINNYLSVITPIVP